MTEAQTRNVFVGIGVAEPAGMTPLPAVRESLDHMAIWATEQGYAQVVTIADDDAPVSAERIREAITPLLVPPPDRIVIFFVGHGFLVPPDQVWILSDGPEVNAGRVSRNALRASLSTYQPSQIAMLSDACLTPRDFPSGAVPILFDRPGPGKRVFVDNIFSTLPNEPSYFFRPEGTDRGFCLFTSVLLDFLRGTHPDSFRLPTGVCRDVTTQTLNWNLPEAVRRRAASLNLDQEPRIEPGFPVGMDVYSRFPAGPSTEDGGRKDPDPPDPPDEATSPHEPRWPEALEARLIGFQPAPPPLMADSMRTEVCNGFQRWNAELAAVVHHSGTNSGWGMIVNQQPTGFLIGPFRDASDEAWWCPVSRADLDRVVPYKDREKRSLLTLSWHADEQSQFLVMVPVFDGLVATLHIRSEEDAEQPSRSGCNQLSWAPLDSFCGKHTYSAKTVLSWRFLKALNSGNLSSSDAQLIAHGLRDEKHINPMIGVVCAYLYDLVGDLNSIARMCHFYKQHSQQVPFDIALLSGGEIRRAVEGNGWEVAYPPAPREKPIEPDYLWMETPAGVAPIAGAAPLLRAGWNRLQALASPDRDLLASLGALSSSLTLAPIATIKGQESIERADQLLQELHVL